MVAEIMAAKIADFMRTHLGASLGNPRLRASRQ
jgi:hypothetical protein